MHGSGFLAIWSDLAPEDETDWAHWMTREHSIERVSIEGFLACRVFRAMGMAVNRYFILYDLAKPGRELSTSGVGQGGCWPPYDSILSRNGRRIRYAVN